MVSYGQLSVLPPRVVEIVDPKLAILSGPQIANEFHLGSWSRPALHSVEMEGFLPQVAD